MWEGNDLRWLVSYDGDKGTTEGGSEERRKMGHARGREGWLVREGLRKAAGVEVTLFKVDHLP